MLGLFDYNLITPPIPSYPITYDPAWYGAHNRKAPSALWESSARADFALASGSPAIDAGLDLSAPFTVDGVSFAPLPGFTSNYFAGAAPDMGAVEHRPAFVPSAPQQLRVLPQ